MSYNRSREQSAWLQYLKKVEYNYVITLTTYFPCRLELMKEKVDQFFRSVLRLMPLSSPSVYQDKVEMFYAIERNESRDGGTHTHALLKVPGGIDSKQLDQLWQEVINRGTKHRKNSRTDIGPPRDKNKSDEYPLKDIGKPGTHHDLLSSSMSDYAPQTVGHNGHSSHETKTVAPKTPSIRKIKKPRTSVLVDLQQTSTLWKQDQNTSHTCEYQQNNKATQASVSKPKKTQSTSMLRTLMAYLSKRLPKLNLRRIRKGFQRFLFFPLRSSSDDEEG